MTDKLYLHWVFYFYEKDRHIVDHIIKESYGNVEFIKCYPSSKHHKGRISYLVKCCPSTYDNLRYKMYSIAYHYPAYY